MKCLSLRCGKEFKPKFAHSKFCSESCYKYEKAKRHYHKRNFDLICVECKITFKGGRSDLLCCSKECIKTSTSKKLTKFKDIPACLEDASRKLDKRLGYVRVYVPMHPEANTWGYVYEHRVVAEQIIGRRLEKDEIVHHKNGKRWDNRSENLEVMNKNDHAKLHGQREEDLDI
jgi:hypothetical protein